MTASGSQSDEELLQEALSGRREAWEELYLRYEGRSSQYVRRKLGDPELALDVLQHHWEELYRAVKNHPPERFGSFFWSLLKRRIVDARRAQGKVREELILNRPASPEDPDGEELLDLISGDAPDPLELMILQEEEQHWETLLATLPLHYRMAIELRNEGYSFREVGELLVVKGGISKSGDLERRAENYYYRGIKKLKEQQNKRAVGERGA